MVGSGSFGFGFVDFGVRVHSASGLICRWLARVHSASDLSILGFGFAFGSNLSVVGSGSFGFGFVDFGVRVHSASGSNLSILGFGFVRLRVEFVGFWGSGSLGFGSNLSIFFLGGGVPVHPARVATMYSYPEAP